MANGQGGRDVDGKIGDSLAKSSEGFDEVLAAHEGGRDDSE